MVAQAGAVGVAPQPTVCFLMVLDNWTGGLLTDAQHVETADTVGEGGPGEQRGEEIVVAWIHRGVSCTNTDEYNHSQRNFGSESNCEVSRHLELAKSGT